MIIRYQSNIGGLLPTPGIYGGVNERKRDPADFWTRERSHLDGGDMGDTPPFRLAKETNHSPRKRLFSLSSGGGWTRLSVDGAPRPPLRSLLLATQVTPHFPLAQCHCRLCGLVQKIGAHKSHLFVSTRPRRLGIPSAVTSGASA